MLAGKEYGSGSSRDWAAKGTTLLGVRAVIAESFERIHRSNLIGMGVLPLQFPEGESIDSLGLTGEETFDVGDLQNGEAKIVEVTASRDGARRRHLRGHRAHRHAQRGELLPERRHPPPGAAGPALARARHVVERTGEVAGLPTHWREAPGEGRPPILYLHGVPTASWEWLPFLERIGGVAPDLPGFGRSAKPEDFDYSIEGYQPWLESFIDSVGLDRFSLVVNDWGGGLGLALAQRIPERIERLVIHTSVPLLPGYRWHWVARVWRTPGLGELFMATSSKWAFRQLTRLSNVSPGPLPDSFIDRIWRDFDRGTRRAILRLYRASPSEVLAGAGEHLGDLSCPTLILWPTEDPYLGREWGPRHAEAIGENATSRDDRARGTLALARPPRRDREDSGFPRGLTAVVSPVSPI